MRTYVIIDIHDRIKWAIHEAHSLQRERDIKVTTHLDYFFFVFLFLLMSSYSYIFSNVIINKYI